ncbi:MAG: MGMT family protein [Candidatus Roizmanbacteria bacterium]
MKTKSTWIQKRDEHKHKPVCKMTPKGLMYISTPKEINEIIRTVPKGKLITTAQIANQLAKKYKTKFTCQITTGIFVAIDANASEEELQQNKLNVTPYWRVIKAKGRLYDKYLGQKSRQKELLESEGYTIEETKVKTAQYQIKEYETFLVT